MAHNPPIPARIDFADRLGVLIMDENRDYGGHQGQGGYTEESVAQEVKDMGKMVQRDRAHPSVFIWSFCNEVGCDNETAAAAFRNISYFYDGTRGVTQNHLGAGATPVSEKSLDVQGFSHKPGATFDKFHAEHPKEPMMATECCSCLSQRGEDYDACTVPRTCVGSECAHGSVHAHDYL
jgi:beta-galactosidase/beta-glucuronidase